MTASPSTNAGLQTALSSFIAQTRYEALPAQLVERLKWSLLDSIACGLYGSRTPWGSKVASFSRLQGTGPCSIWGQPGAGVSALNAILANGTMVQGYELDDTHFGSRSHPGSITVPMILALAEESHDLTGRDALVAMAMGYEVLARVGASQGVSSFERGWHPTGSAGSFAAAATASRLLGLDAAATSHALGIAGTMPTGLMSAQYGAMVKRLFAGHTGWVGLTSALLAKDDFTGIADIFEAEYGGYPAAVSDDFDLTPLTAELGNVYQGAAVGYKFFACVGTNQTALQAVLGLMTAHSLAADDVDSVAVTTSSYQVLHSGWEYEPGAVLTAQMNMKYCIATLLRHGVLFVDQFAPEHLAAPETLELVERITVLTDAGQSDKDRTAQVVIRLKSGKVFEASCSAALGHPSNPPQSTDVEGKFRTLVRDIIPADSAEEIIRVVAQLDDVDDLTRLTRLVAPPQV